MERRGRRINVNDLDFSATSELERGIVKNGMICQIEKGSVIRTRIFYKEGVEVKDGDSVVFARNIYTGYGDWAFLIRINGKSCQIWTDYFMTRLERGF